MSWFSDDLIVTSAWTPYHFVFKHVRKIAKSDYWLRHVCPCPWNNSAPTGRIFMQFVIWGFLKKYVAKIKVSLKSDKNNVYFTWRPIYLFIISRSFLLRMRNVSDKSCRENQNTHFVFCNFFFGNRAVYEKMWKNTVERGRPRMTIWRMRIACWIPASQ